MHLLRVEEVQGVGDELEVLDVAKLGVGVGKHRRARHALVILH